MKKEQDQNKKDINLMPEDLRSKESGILSKAKSATDFDFDFVSPKDSALKKANQKSQTSIWQQIKNIFSRPVSFGQSSDKPKHKKEDKKEKTKPLQEVKKKEDKKESISLHIPEKKLDTHKDDLKVDYNTNILDDNKKEDVYDLEKIAHSFDNQDKDKSEDDILKTKKKAKSDKIKGLSIWQKIKNFFAGGKKTPKVPKAPKMERVPEKPIIPKDIADIKQPIEKDETLDILAEQKIKAIPELKPVKEKKSLFGNFGHNSKMEIKDRQMSPSLDSLSEDKKESDFSLPSVPALKKKKAKFADDITTEIDHSEEEKKKEPEDSKDEELADKFHKPLSRIRARLLDSGGGVDLIPDSAKTRSWRQIVNLLLISSIGSLFVVAIFYVFLFYKGQSIEEQKDNKYKQITDLEQQIINYEALNDDITKLGNEITAIHTLLNFHIYWTNFFQLLEKYTIAEVYYSGITAGNGGALTLEATASDYESLARQIKVLKQEDAQEFVSDISVSSAEYDNESGVQFEMTLVLNPSLFVYNKNYIYEIVGNYTVDEEE